MGLGKKQQKQIYNTYSNFIVSRLAIIQIAMMMIALFLPISRTQFYHHKISVKQEDDQNSELNDYHNFYENIPSPHISNNLQFRHHKKKKKLKLLPKKDYEFDIVTPEPEFRFKHHSRLKSILEQPFKTHAESITEYPKRIAPNVDGENRVELEKDKIARKKAETAEPICVLRGNTVTIPCKHGKSFISPGIVSWQYADGKRITAERFAIESDGNLVITNAQPSDSNPYICEIEDNQQVQSVLKVYQPRVPALEISIQLQMDETKYPNNNQSAECKTSELMPLKAIIKEELSNLGESRCTIIDLRISCQFISTKAALQDLLMNSKRADEQILKARHITTCSGGYGLQDVPCNPGYYSNEGSVDCIKCKPGSYQPNYGSSECNSCKQYWSESGSTSEDNCHT
uniref:Ig-like domain-containing protein n=1 Tax=Strigamia maritima TaxID=126957 RepID=T1IST7_STRMM